MGSLEVIFISLPYLLQGALVTLRIVALSLGLGLCMGLPLAVGQVYGSPLTQKIVKFYVWIFRGLPNLVLLFLFFFGIFPSIGIDASAFTTAVVVLGQPINPRFLGEVSYPLEKDKCWRRAL